MDPIRQGMRRGAAVFGFLKAWKLNRKANRAERRGERIPVDETAESFNVPNDEDAAMLDWFKRKTKGALGSSTIGVAGAIIAAGAWAQAHPEVIDALVKDGYEGVTLSAIGLAVAIARLRTLGKP